MQDFFAPGRESARHNTPADIVKVRKSTKSHVSSSLKSLESKGLIERHRSAQNKKHTRRIVGYESESPL